MNQSDPTNAAANRADDWGACPPGELRALSDRLQAADRRRRRASLARVTATAASAAAVLVLAVNLAVNGSLVPPAAITCDECFAQFDPFADHLEQRASMDAALARRVDYHLGGCRKCQDHFEQMHPGLLQARGVVGVFKAGSPAVLGSSL